MSALRRHEPQTRPRAPKTRLADLPLVEPPDRPSWRTWLETHHASSSGIWLAVGKKGNMVTTLTYDDAVEEALCFGWIDSTVNRLDANRFKQLFTPRKPGGTWARTNKERVERLIEAGQMTPAGLAPIEAAKADGSWTLLDDVDALVIPPDLEAALAADPIVERGFDLFPDSRKKQLLYWIITAKRAETRARRIAETLRAAAEAPAPPS
ncbi:MAG: YdeI/OmpD-associated family protein [Thermoleophilia bacterium]